MKSNNVSNVMYIFGQWIRFNFSNSQNFKVKTRKLGTTCLLLYICCLQDMISEVFIKIID